MQYSTNNVPKSSILVQAKKYLNQGLSLVPIHPKGKRPLIEWKEFQSRRATEEEIDTWFTQWPDANIGIITGRISNLTVVDIDKGGPLTDLPPTATVRTGGDGWHYYYKYHQDAPTDSRVRDRTDIRSDGGLVVAPPSIHASGQEYEWSVPIEDVDLQSPPAWVYETKSDKNVSYDYKQILETEVFEGARNQTAAQVIGKMLVTMAPTQWEVVAWPMIQQWNTKKCKPPLQEKELRNVWNSIVKAEKESRKGKKTSQADILVEDVLNSPDIYLFIDERGAPHAHIKTERGHQILSCKGKAFRHWLSKRYYDASGKAASSETIKTTLSIIFGRAHFGGNRHPLSVRVSEDSGTIYYDLGENDWRSVAVSDNGWQYVDNPPILFRRYNHQKQQAEPTTGGDIRLLFDFINLSKPEDQCLLMTYIISCFIPGFPHPSMVLHGQQGAAKSMTAKILRRIIDPSALSLLSLPKTHENLVQILSKHWFVFFDNITHMPNDMSDALCRAVTGEGFSKRELYSDDDDIIYTFQRCVGLNGINIAAQNADLLDRSIVFELERIPDDKRRPEKEIWAEFDQKLPEILGGVFDTLTKAIAIYPSVNLPVLPRMADFAVWGEAIAQALGYEPTHFLYAFMQNQEQQNDHALEDNPIGFAVQRFMENKDIWIGTASELLNALKYNAYELGIDTFKDRSWPTRPNVLSRKLNLVRTNLKRAGVHVTIHQRTITIRKGEENTVNTDNIDETEKSSIRDNFGED